MSMFGSYSNCPVCGIIHDDGAIYNVKDKTYFVCFDCSDLMTDVEIEKIIERNKTYGKNRNKKEKIRTEDGRTEKKTC